VDRDLYVEGMNFVFGLSSRFKGSVLSVYRLPSQEMVEKEAIHEMGHVLGLGHCGNFCVMQFSNSLEEAMEKPGYFCERCRKALRGR
jgi:archaemetzincin